MYSNDIAVRIKELLKEIDTLDSKEFSLSEFKGFLGRVKTLMLDFSAELADNDFPYDSWPGAYSLPVSISTAKNPEDTFGDDFGWDSK